MILSLLSLFTLVCLGLIRRKDALIVVEISSQWTQLRKQLRLIEEREDNVNQDSISYVSAGMSLSVCCVNCCVNMLLECNFPVQKGDNLRAYLSLLFAVLFLFRLCAFVGASGATAGPQRHQLELHRRHLTATARSRAGVYAVQHSRASVRGP